MSTALRLKHLQKRKPRAVHHPLAEQDSGGRGQQ